MPDLVRSLSTRLNACLGESLRLFELRLDMAGRDPPESDEHDRVSELQLADGAIPGVVVERRSAKEPPGSREAGDARTFGVAVVADDRDAVGVRERALALLIGIAGEAAGALAAEDRAVAVGSYRGLGSGRAGEPTDGFPADVTWFATGQQADVSIINAAVA